jgi:hypothetical protein
MQKHTAPANDATQQRITYAKQLLAFLHGLKIELTAESLDHMLPTLNLLEEAYDNTDPDDHTLDFQIDLYSSTSNAHPRLIISTGQVPMPKTVPNMGLEFKANFRINELTEAIEPIDFSIYDRMTIWDIFQCI